MAIYTRLLSLVGLSVTLFYLASCTTTSFPVVQNTTIFEPVTPSAKHTETPFTERAIVVNETPIPISPTPIPGLWIADYVPGVIADHVISNLGDQVVISESKQTSEWRLDMGGDFPLAEWVYVLVAPFPTITDGIAVDELRAAWRGEWDAGPLAEILIKTDYDTYALFSVLWGKPPVEAVEVILPDELLKIAWDDPSSWAILPFERLDPRWKVLQIDGVSPIQNNFDPTVYPLTVNFSLSGDSPVIDTISNFDPSIMTDIMLTGVTALVRGTALTMERKGITYPGEDIAALTRRVDFMHVNNEIPFTPDCPFPKLIMEKLVFCSDVRYLELLEFIGTDFLEASGDHFGDHGSEGTLFTLDLYDEIGLPYYGGGRDLEDGRKPLLIEHHGNKIAIMGCNAKGSDYYAPANGNTPGAVPCDFDWMVGEIARLNDNGYQVIITLQHVEYYSYEAQPDLVRDFGRLAAAGAVIVSGSQSHQAHGMAFEDGAFIHYGLGNLFFDQYLYCENADCDYAFMDRHIFYDGRHISTELIPIRFIDMARPRPMKAEEKAWFLDWIFEASGWESR